MLGFNQSSPSSWGKFSSHLEFDSFLTEVSLLGESTHPSSPIGSPSTQRPRYPLIPFISGFSSHHGCSSLVPCLNLFTSPFHIITTCLFSLVFITGYTTVSPKSTPSPSACMASQSSFLDSSLTSTPTGFLGEFHIVSRQGEVVMDPQSQCAIRSTSFSSIA